MKERSKHKAALTDRKSLAAQNRMKSITTLASDVATKKRKKKGGDDMFGANDADWAVYREIVSNTVPTNPVYSCLSRFPGWRRI